MSRNYKAISSILCSWTNATNSLYQGDEIGRLNNKAQQFIGMHGETTDIYLLYLATVLVWICENPDILDVRF